MGQDLENSSIEKFLRESNAIESVYDEDSLNQAMFAWEYLISEDELTPSVILKTHKILMLNQQHLRPNERGYFREVEVLIGGCYGAKARHVPDLIGNWCRKISSPVPITKDFIGLHIDYEEIHPFVDGNGRTGRMFLNWMRVKDGQPILVIFENKKQDYYKWFR